MRWDLHIEDNFRKDYQIDFLPFLLMGRMTDKRTNHYYISVGWLFWGIEYEFEIDKK